MRKLIVLAFLLISYFTKAQNVIEWDGNYQLQLSDFRSASSQIGGVNIFSLNSASGIEFSFYMSRGEFMFTKNFNAKVGCSFKRDASSLIAPDSSAAIKLLSFARYDFDLAELYSRKLRKKLYEEKGALSDVSFFKPLYDNVQSEFTDRRANALKETDIGRNSEELKMLHEEVLVGILELPDFCKTCKPLKRKK